MENYIAENVRRLRTQSKLSRREVLELLKDCDVSMHETTLRRIEEGEHIPKATDAAALANVLGIGLEELVCRPTDQTDAEIRVQLARVREDEKTMRLHKGFWITGCYNFEQKLNGLHPDARSLESFREAKEYLAETLEEREALNQVTPSHVSR